MQYRYGDIATKHKPYWKSHVLADYHVSDVSNVPPKRSIAIVNVLDSDSEDVANVIYDARHDVMTTAYCL